jgi:ubiquinone/menaquinone biosynthesis C-methylase UbiE
LDYDHASLKNHKTIKLCIHGDISHLPFLDEAFDLVTSNMVLEHLQNPEIQLQEIFRILKPEGLFIFHTPNLRCYSTLFARLLPMSLKSKLIWFLQKRKDQDVFPTYYRINTTRDIKRIAELTGFQIKKIRLIVSSAQCVMLPPIIILELLLIRLLMTRFGRPFRTNMISILKKPNPSLKLSARAG